MEDKPKKAWYKKWWGITLIIIGVFIIIGIFIPNPETSEEKKTETPSKEATSEASKQETQETTPPPEETTPEYQIVHTLDNFRFDGGVTYYVLIDPVDLSNANFKKDIEAIVKDMVKEKGGKISVEIHDNKSTLELSFKKYGELSLKRTLTKEEIKQLETHIVATFDGELETGPYKNTLMYFLQATKQHPTVGKYVQTLEFNP